MKRIIYYLFLLLILVSCSSIKDFKKPAIFCQGSYSIFDKSTLVYPIEIFPYVNDKINIVSANLIDIKGDTIESLELENNENYPSNLDGEKHYLLKAKNQLPEGMYMIEIIHQIDDIVKRETILLNVFRTGLEETNRNLIDGYFKNYSYYGNYQIINAIPTSYLNIKADQFRIEFLTDKDNQRPPVRGLNITRDNNFFFDANSNSASLRIYWQNPYFDEQVDLYKNSVDIRQKAPTINTLNMQEEPPSGTEKRIRLRVRNLKFLDPDIGGEGRPQINVFVDKTAKCAVEGYSASEPQLYLDDDSYIVELELNGNLPKGETKVKGTVSFNINAQATNPINGKVSSVESKAINLRINFEPKKGY